MSLQEGCICIRHHSEPKALACWSFHGPVPNFLPPASLFLPPPTCQHSHVCTGIAGGKFILHKQFTLWPLFERASQVANSDVDTCLFGTGMKTATHFLETIKHPVSEQQLSANCNLGEAQTGHTDSQLPVLGAIRLPSNWWNFLIPSLQYSLRRVQQLGL